MKSVKRLVGVALGTIALIAGGAVTAPSASAVVVATCTNSVCIKATGTGYEISYYNGTGQWKYVEFGLECWTGGSTLYQYNSGGAFTSWPGTTRYYFWSKGNKQSCRGKMDNHTDKTTTYTRWV